MGKKFIKSLVMLGSLLLVLHFSMRAEKSPTQIVDVESYLKPEEISLLNQDDPMVYLSPEVAQVIRELNSEDEAVKELVEYAKMGYSVAPLNVVFEPIEYVLKVFDVNSSQYAIVSKYYQSLLNGDAIFGKNQIGNRRRKEGNFCTLFVQNCSSLGCLNVRSTANICGNLTAGGTISASNFVFTGTTGCSDVLSTLPAISSCGNITFNTSGMNQLYAQGTLESRLKIIRATIALGVPGIILIPTAVNPGGPIIVGVATPNSASLNAGTGLNVGSISGNAFSSGMLGSTPIAGTLEYYFIVDLQIPVTFDSSYLTVPTITYGVQSTNPIVSAPRTASVDANSASTTQVSISNVTIDGAILNVLFTVIAQGTSYMDAANNAAIAINTNISNPVTSNNFYINLVVDGPVV